MFSMCNVIRRQRQTAEIIMHFRCRQQKQPSQSGFPSSQRIRCEQFHLPISVSAGRTCRLNRAINLKPSGCGTTQIRIFIHLIFSRTQTLWGSCAKKENLLIKMWSLWIMIEAECVAVLRYLAMHPTVKNIKLKKAANNYKLNNNQRC